MPANGEINEPPGDLHNIHLQHIEANRMSNLSHLNLVPEFSGKPESVNIDTFFNRIDEMSLMGNWTRMQQAIITKLKLVGDAREYVDNNPLLQNATYEVLREKLKSWFHVEESHSQLVQNFLQCTQRPGENVRQFATRLSIAGYKTLVKTNNAEEQEMRVKILDESMLAQFIKGINGNIKRFVMSKNPESYEGALTIAFQEERCEETMTNKPLIVNSIDGLSTEAKKGQLGRDKDKQKHKVNRQVHFGQEHRNSDANSFHAPGMDQPQGNYGNLTCQRCGGRGHWANNCATPTQFQAGSASYSNQDRSNRNGEFVPTCYNCNQIGHVSRYCQQNRQQRSFNSQGYGYRNNRGRSSGNWMNTTTYTQRNNGRDNREDYCRSQSPGRNPQESQSQEPRFENESLNANALSLNSHMAGPKQK
jgi:Zinc knuckle